MSEPPSRGRVGTLALLLGGLVVPGPGAAPAGAQEPTPPVGREAAERLRFPQLEFRAPEAERHELPGDVPVFFLEDRSLPLVNVYARFRGGFGLFPRDLYAAATAAPGLLRSAGTTSLTPDSLDHLLELHALQVSFGTGGESSFSSLNTLRDQLHVAMELWSDMLRNPRFDSAQVEVWRGQELESARRRMDEPTRLAFSQFNRLMFGDHPIGWEMEPADLEPERLSRESLFRVHRRVFCPDHLVLGVTGDVSWREIRPLLEALLEGWPACTEALPPAPLPDIRREAAVYLIPRPLSQSTVVMAHPGGIRQEDSAEYFASRIGNSVLGAGGFSSRILSRVRTQRGYAYSASSLWTTPARSEGIVGALTQTRSETTIAATRLILEIMEEMRRAPPTAEEVRLAVEEIANGFVFNFEDPGQIVARQMFYLAQDMPEDWLERYLDGIQGVTPRQVQDVFRRHLHPDRMTILILGDPEAFDEPPDVLGPVRIWDVERRW